MREFHQVSDSVAQQQLTHASGLASNMGYRTAPHEVEGVGQPEPQGLLIVVVYELLKINAFKCTKY